MCNGGYIYSMDISEKCLSRFDSGPGGGSKLMDTETSLQEIKLSKLIEYALPLRKILVEESNKLPLWGKGLSVQVPESCEGIHCSQP